MKQFNDRFSSSTTSRSCAILASHQIYKTESLPPNLAFHLWSYGATGYPNACYCDAAA